MTRFWIFWLLAAALPLLALGCAAASRRHPATSPLRIAAGARVLTGMVLAWVLLQPQCSRRQSITTKPRLAVVIDTSQSMNDGPDGHPRHQAVHEWLESPAFRQARETCELHYFSLADELLERVPGDLAYDGTQSRLRHGLLDWTARWGRADTAAMVLLSDGLDTDGGAPPVLDIPCHVLELEPPAQAGNARITVWQVEPPRRPMAGAETSVRVVLQGWDVENRDIPVEVWADDHVLASKTIRFTHRGDVAEAILPLKPERPGSYAYQIRVADPAADPAAKSQPFVMAVRQEGRSLLLLENALGFEGKFLRRALTTDRNIRLDSFARWQDGRWAALGDGASATTTANLDLSPAGLSSRAAVVIADVSPDALTHAQWQALAQFTNDGGGLAVLGGPNLLGSPAAATVLGSILPVPTPAPHRDGRFVVKLTDQGLRHPVFGPLFESVKDFPALQGANSATGVASNAQVLMEAVADGQARPLVVVKQHGAGRVAVILSDTLWRWRIAAPGWSGRLSPYDTLWSQLLDWLAPDQDGLLGSGRLELTTDRAFYRQGDTAVVQIAWLGRNPAPFAAPGLRGTDPGGKPLALTPAPATWVDPDGRHVTGFRASLPAAATGVYHLTADATWPGGDAKAETRVAVAASPAERRGEAADDAWLAELARQSGGSRWARDQSDAFRKILPAPTHRSEREVVTDVWNHPAAALVLLGCLGLEWWLRRRRGLA